MADLAHKAVRIGLGHIHKIDTLEARRQREARLLSRRANTLGASQTWITFAIVAFNHQGAGGINEIEVANRCRARFKPVAQGAAGPFHAWHAEFQDAQELTFGLIRIGSKKRLFQQSPKCLAIRRQCHAFITARATYTIGHAGGGAGRHLQRRMVG